MDLSRWIGRLAGVHPEVAEPARPGAERADGVGALVVGGGIAGMSAAVVLAERGVRVTVLESRPRLGGRLGSWPATLPDGTAQMIDHGFHAFFRQYYNWRSILRRADPRLGFLRPVDRYPVLSTSWPAEEFGRLPAAPPLNLLALIARSPSLRLPELRGMDGKAAVPLLAYHPERTYEELDKVSAAELLDGLKLPDRARAMLFEVFAHSFFNHERDMSAAELVASFHFYFLGNPEGLAFDAPGLDYETAIWQPMTAHLQRHGATVHCATPAASVARVGAQWQVTGADGRRWAADHLVLAVDPPALRALGAASPELATAVPTLPDFGSGPPYAVARYWLDRDVAPARPIFSGVSRQPTLDSVTLYHRLDAGARDWARRTGGAVVELHAYACDDDVPADVLAGRMRAELLELWPEATGQVVHVQARVERQAPSFDLGSAGPRPRVTTGADGLYLAGDGIHTDFPSALMERSAATGILAANQILAGAGVATEPVWSIRRRGLLAARD